MWQTLFAISGCDTFRFIVHPIRILIREDIIPHHLTVKLILSFVLNLKTQTRTHKIQQHVFLSVYSTLILLHPVIYPVTLKFLFFSKMGTIFYLNNCYTKLSLLIFISQIFYLLPESLCKQCCFVVIYYLFLHTFPSYN